MNKSKGLREERKLDIPFRSPEQVFGYIMSKIDLPLENFENLSRDKLKTLFNATVKEEFKYCEITGGDIYELSRLFITIFPSDEEKYSKGIRCLPQYLREISRLPEECDFQYSDSVTKRMMERISKVDEIKEELVKDLPVILEAKLEELSKKLSEELAEGLPKEVETTEIQEKDIRRDIRDYNINYDEDDVSIEDSLSLVELSLVEEESDLLPDTISWTISWIARNVNLGVPFKGYG